MVEGPRPFAHLNGSNAGLYRAMMSTFVHAKRRFAVHLRPEDVHEALIRRNGSAPDLAEITSALANLSSEDWGNLRADPDTSRVTTVEDFHRARYLYQLTRHGEAAEEAERKSVV